MLGFKMIYKKGQSLPRANLVASIPNRYPFIDRIGKHDGPAQLRQYVHVASGTVTLYHPTITGSETITSSGDAPVSAIAGGIVIGVGKVWEIKDSAGHHWPHCAALTPTSVVMWDVSGLGDHLIAEGLSEAVVTALCSTSRDLTIGTDWLNAVGYIKYYPSRPVIPISNELASYPGGLSTANKTIKMWGDSLTAGTSPRLRSKYYYTDVTGGVGGETSTQIKDRLLSSLNIGDISVIWAGNNNPDPYNTVMADVAECVSSLGHDNFIIMGMLINATNASGNSIKTAVLDGNAALATLYGSKFINILDHLITFATSSAGDIEDVANGITPRSLRIDDIHLTSNGYGIVADKVLSTAINLHYIDNFADYGTGGYLTGKALTISNGLVISDIRQITGISAISGFTIHSFEGSGLLQVVGGNRLAYSIAGTVYNLKLKLASGKILTFPLCEGHGSTVYGYEEDNPTPYIANLYHNGNVISSVWATEQRTYFQGLEYGYNVLNDGDLGPERIIQGDSIFSSVSAFWVFGTGWSVASEEALHTGTTGGLLYANCMLNGGNYRVTFDVPIYGGSLIGISGGTLTGGFYPSSSGHKTKDFVSVSHQLNFYSTSTSSIDNISLREILTAQVVIPGNPYNPGYDCAGNALQNYPLVVGPPRNNITRLTGTSTAINPTDTYILDDTNGWRIVTDWTAGTANDFFDADGVPIPFSGQQAIDAGIGPRFYCGSKGIAGYTVDQDAAANAKIIRILKVPTYIDTLYWSDSAEMDWSATSE